MEGQVFSHFRILEKLGEGGMGVVYKAQDLQLNRLVALKFLPPAIQNDPAALARFQHEAQAIAALNHPHIATIHSLEEDRGQKFIVLEYLPGGTLKDTLKNGKLHISKVLDYAVQIGEGLASAHKSGVVHRDLKADNIMLTKEGQSKITDFGLAKLQGGTKLTQTGSTVGTVAYMSPEQARGEEADARSDIFSFGVVLYELVTGELPFKGEQRDAVLYGILHEAPRPMYALRSEVPAGLEKIVERALEKKVAKRYQTVEEMLQDLRGVSASGPPVSRWARVFRKSRRWAVPVAALILVSLIPYFKRHFWPAAPVSVAVLPFEVTGGNSDENSWLTEGIGQSIATKLTKLKDVRVTPWVTSQRYIGPSLALKDSLKSVASELGVERLLIGTVRIFGERVHTAVQLIDQTGRQQIWSDEMDESKADIFEVYKKIALGVAEGLKGNFSGEEEKLLAQPPAQTADAYELYIKGSLKLQSETPEDEDVALAFFDKAIELDPKLAEAYVGRGAVYRDRYFYGWGGKEDLDKAEENFRKALTLDPQSTNARLGLMGHFAEMGQAEENLKQGAAVPKDGDNIGALQVRALSYFSSGLPDRAVPLYQRILQLDPANNSALWHLIIVLDWSQHAQEAIDAGETYFGKFGEDPEVHTWVADAYQQLGDLDAAAIHCDRAIELFGKYSNEYVYLNAGILYRQLGDTAKSIAYLTILAQHLEVKLKAHPSNFRMSSILAACYALSGKYNEAKEILLRSRPFFEDDCIIALMLFLKSGHSDLLQAARAIFQDILSNGQNLLYAEKIYQQEGFFQEKDLLLIKNEGVLDKMIALDARLRAKY